MIRRKNIPTQEYSVRSKHPILGQNWSCLLSGGSMTVTFLGVAAPAKMRSPPSYIQKLVRLRHSPRTTCAVYAQHRLVLLAILSSALH